MARDYGTRRTARGKSSGPHQFLVVTVTFLLGYLTASVFDVQTISHWMNTQVLASHQDSSSQPNKVTHQTAQIPPKPKFEFYTLLANEKGAAAAQANRAATTTPTATTPAANTATVTQPQTLATAGTTQVNTATVDTQPPAVAHVAEGKPLGPAKISKGAFLVQVASFKVRKDAEHMKGSLTLKGFDVTIVPINHAGGNWFRVVIGPYANKGLAQHAQMTIAKNEHLKGMVTPVKG